MIYILVLVRQARLLPIGALATLTIRLQSHSVIFPQKHLVQVCLMVSLMNVLPLLAGK